MSFIEVRQYIAGSFSQKLQNIVPCFAFCEKYGQNSKSNLKFLYSTTKDRKAKSN